MHRAAWRRTRFLAVVLLSLSLTACTGTEEKAYRTLASTAVEYEGVRGRIVESALHGLLDEEQMDRYLAAEHSFREAHQAAVEALAAWATTHTGADLARLEASLEALPRFLQRLNQLAAEFDSHPAPQPGPFDSTVRYQPSGAGSQSPRRSISIPLSEAA